MRHRKGTETIPLIPDKETIRWRYQLNHHKRTRNHEHNIRQTQHIRSTKEIQMFRDTKDQLISVIEARAAVKETTEEPNSPIKTQPQSECTENPPFSFKKRLTRLSLD